jgi:hypothetical protein
MFFLFLKKNGRPSAPGFIKNNNCNAKLFPFEPIKSFETLSSSSMAVTNLEQLSGSASRNISQNETFVEV